jgi:hypothetical protein
MTRAVAVFTVSLRGLKLRVRLLPTEADVNVECHRYERRRQRGAPIAGAFFAPALKLCSVAGTIVLPATGRLVELVPHEVVHAVMHRVGSVDSAADERLATDVGLLSARILRQIARRGIEVRP